MAKWKLPDETADFEGEQDMLFLETLTEKFKTLDVKPETIRLFPEIYPKYGASKMGKLFLVGTNC